MKKKVSSNQVTGANLVDLISSLSEVEDPRVVNRCKHRLIDVLVIAVLSVLSGAEGVTDMVTFAHSKEQWLKKFIKLPCGVPSHDTMARVLSLIDCEQIDRLFLEWTKTFVDTKKLKSISLDGKTTKGTYGEFNDGTRPFHTVSVYSHELGLTLLESEASGSGTGEIKAAMSCIEALDLKGVTVLLDAGIGRKKVLDKVLDKGGSYVAPVKRNCPSSLQELEELFLEYEGRKKSVSEKGHGRREKRVCRLLSSSKLSTKFKEKWPEVKSVFLIERQIEVKDRQYTVLKREENSKSSHHVRNENFGGYKLKDSKIYYVSNRNLTASEAIEETRKHWGIENNLHWVLDVAFKEDDWTVKSKVLAKKLSVIRKIALNLIRSRNLKGSVRSQIKKAGWDNQFLEKLAFAKF